jgi:hypothetical protein
MGICRFFFGIFDRIDFEIIALKEEDNVFLDPARQGQQPLTPVCVTLLKCMKRSFLRFIMCGM